MVFQRLVVYVGAVQYLLLVAFGLSELLQVLLIVLVPEVFVVLLALQEQSEVLGALLSPEPREAQHPADHPGDEVAADAPRARPPEEGRDDLVHVPSRGQTSPAGRIKPSNDLPGHHPAE
jgi:hypothetical protein